MRHLTAFQIDGGWRYASLSRRGGGPIGYCAEHDPHPTEAEARECYAQYQRDNIRLDSTWSWSSCHVKDCPNPANKGAQSGAYNMALLCDEHHTMEHAIVALGLDTRAGDAWVS